MATHIEVGRAGSDLRNGVAAVETALVASATITPNGTSQATTLTVPADTMRLNGGYFVTLTADENIYFNIGTTPDASATPRRALAGGQRATFAFEAGQQVAVMSR